MHEASTPDGGKMWQVCPYPDVLADLVARCDYRAHEGWSMRLVDMERDPGSRGLTLVITRSGPDSYHLDRVMRVAHYFPVPPATFDERSWRRWLFDRCGDVDTHERMELFKIDGVPVYPPAHGPGNSPYLVLEYGTDVDRRTSFRGDLNPA